MGMLEERLVPIMTGPTTDGVTITESSKYNDSFPGWNAFTGKLATGSDDSNAWATELRTTSGWVLINFKNNTRIVSRYTITSRYIINPNYALECPNSWTFEGSMDGIKFDILHKVTNSINWGHNEKRTFVIENIKPYAYYRLNITANNGHQILAIDEIELFGFVNNIKYLIECDDKIYSIDEKYYSDISSNYIEIAHNELTPEIFNQYGFSNVSNLTEYVTLENETFKPIDKFNSNIRLIKYTQ